MVGRNEPSNCGVVVSGLEVIEFGLSVLGLTAMLNYALDTHTKSIGFRVGVDC